ncbi:PaaI family thioesterase [Dysgonomonas sp. 511]|uniref:PaaI family thioesterase n=1 Tax=Dysgonomonas sp. 511 TaxID=2302930 RepID=UPI0013D0F161|nr:PaaI family thioesterase [Dysgonomonas sp. 511]NDV79558.1 PaaI family thioesterase [Dysgonomonas sp. 511]
MKLDPQRITDHLKGTLMETLGIVFTESDDPESLEAFMPVEQMLTQTLGVLHGGATISLAETVAGAGSNMLCAEDEVCFGMQISASHISSTRVGDTVKAKGTIIHKGRTTHIWDVNVVSDKTGHLISSVRVTNAVVKKTHSPA